MLKKELLLLTILLSGCNLSTSSVNSLSSVSSSTIEVSSSEFNPYTYIKESSFNELMNKIENKEDFIFIISSDYCSYCQRQEDEIFNYIHLNPCDMYCYNIDKMFDDLELDKEDEKYKSALNEYRYFASMIEKIGDYILGGEGLYIKDYFTDRFGIKEPSIIYPSTFMYIDGEVNIENSKIGHGWTGSQQNFIEYINKFNELRN